MLNKIKELFFGKKQNQTHSTSGRSEQGRKVLPAGILTRETQPRELVQSGDGEVQIVSKLPGLNKFDAEFHEPRLQCFYCSQLIESGKIRFFKAPGQYQEGAYHKRCFKKLKGGKLPGQ